MDSREALVALNLLPDIGPVRVRNLLSRFESAAAVLSASQGDLMLVDKVGVKATLLRWWARDSRHYMVAKRLSG